MTLKAIKLTKYVPQRMDSASGKGLVAPGINS